MRNRSSSESQSSSRDLIVKSTSGDPAALEALLEGQLPALRAFIRLRVGRLIKERESEADLVQSVCREVLEDLPRYEYRGEAAFRQWLFTAALHKIMNRGRFHGRRLAAGALEIALGRDPESDRRESQTFQGLAQAFTPSRNAMLREEACRIEKAFEQLEEGDREVMLLSRLIGLSRKEIAEQMGQNEEAVKKHLARALGRFARIFDSLRTR